jgi:hypothetical protein
MNTEKLMMYNTVKLSEGKIWLLFLLCGWSYGSMNQMGKQILFYITFGGCFFWMFYRMVTLNSKIKEYNRKKAIEIGMTSQELSMLGLV